MGLVLVGVNAQYIHTALAVRQLGAVLRQGGFDDVTVAEFTINQRADDILEALVGLNAQGYLFSCYIWNIGVVRQVAASLRKVCPGAVLGAGGPQVAFCAEEFLAQNSAFDMVMVGEGEEAVLPLASALQNGSDLTACPGLVLRGPEGGVCETPAAPLPAMYDLPFPYEDLQAIEGRIVYYESMRGCPYHCSYCLSGGDGAVRAKSLPRVVAELDRFLAAGVRQVKLVDRTFNCDGPRALAIWQYLARHDNGTTGFHFELAGDLLTEEMLTFLAGVRPGLFQFEIGVQSANPDTLRAIHRRAALDGLFAKVARLRKAGNVHLHLDLIAGLPYEDFASFAKSFDIVYAQRPHQMQLGFLKVLCGSEMEKRAAEYGLVWRDEAPFEILSNQWIGYSELCELKWMGEMVELYHNSGRFAYSIAHLCAQWPSAFGFYHALSRFYRARGHHEAPLSKRGQYQLLADFAAAQGHGPAEALQWLCRYDMALHEKPRTLPPFVTVDGSRPHRARVLAFYREEANLRRYLPGHVDTEPKLLLKTAHVEVLPFHPETGQPGEHAFLFDYARRDVTGKAWCVEIQLPEGPLNE